MINNSIISAKAIKKTFVVNEKENSRNIEVLKGLDLEIGRGEALCIMGSSGAGKSTLLHILSSLDKPTSGSVQISNKNISIMNDDTLADLRNQTMGFVFQFHHLLNEFSALENVMMPLLIGGVSFKEARKKAEVILVELGLQDRLTHRPNMMSGGEQQRVAIGRALIRDPAIIFADEPTGNLDRKTGEQVQRLLFELQRKRGLTLVAVTHDQDFARWFTKIRILRDGMWVG